MEIRVLEYFLAIVREGSINKAADVLHVTQPTLSRQIAQLEEELGVQLFVRNGRRLVLTEEGRLLWRRAESIVDLTEKTKADLSVKDAYMEGTIVIGSGEVAAVEDIALIIEKFHQQYPRVSFDLVTAGADLIKEQMDGGLVDIGVLLEPVELDSFDFIRLKDRERCVVLMGPQDPLCEKDAVTAKDLKDGPLILPRRSGVRNEVANWFGNFYADIHILFTSNLNTNGAIMVQHGLARSIVIEGATTLVDPTKVVSRPLYPELTASSVIAWRKHQPGNPAVRRFIEYINAYQA